MMIDYNLNDVFIINVWKELEMFFINNEFKYNMYCGKLIVNFVYVELNVY